MPTPRVFSAATGAQHRHGSRVRSSYDRHRTEASRCASHSYNRGRQPLHRCRNLDDRRSIDRRLVRSRSTTRSKYRGESRREGSAFGRAGSGARRERSTSRRVPRVYHAKPGRQMIRRFIYLVASSILWATAAASAPSPDSLLYEPAMDLRIGGAIESAIRNVASLPGTSTRSAGSLREAEALVRSGAGAGIAARFEEPGGRGAILWRSL